MVQPTLDLGDAGGTVYADERFRIAVPLGARVPQKRYLRWNEVLRDIVAGWPRGVAAPEFRLLGQGASARKDLQSIDADLVARHGVVEIDSGDLRKAAVDIAACDAFLGVDGGLMHVAVAVGTPGLALFADIEPAYFLRPGGSMAAMRSKGDVSALDAARVAGEFLSALPRLARGGEAAADHVSAALTAAATVSGAMPLTSCPSARSAVASLPGGRRQAGSIAGIEQAEHRRRRRAGEVQQAAIGADDERRARHRLLRAVQDRWRRPGRARRRRRRLP